jgi:flagellar basal body-associated protein FliL
MVNLGGAASSYLKCKVALGLKKEAKAAKLEEEAAPIRDIVVDILASASRDSLKTHEAREKLKMTIQAKLNEELHDEPVAKVYLTDFATQ